MNWHYGDPIVNKEYLCCVKGYSNPISLDWCDGEWGHWNYSKEFYALDNISVVCYIGFDEIPTPEGW